MLKGKSSVKNWQIFLFVNGKPVQQLFTHQNFIVQSISKSYKILVLTTGSTKIDKQHCHLSSMQCMCDVKELSMKFGKRSVGRGQNGAVEKSMARSLMSCIHCLAAKLLQDAGAVFQFSCYFTQQFQNLEAHYYM